MKEAEFQLDLAGCVGFWQAELGWAKAFWLNDISRNIGVRHLSNSESNNLESCVYTHVVEWQKKLLKDKVSLDSEDS